MNSGQPQFTIPVTFIPSHIRVNGRQAAEMMGFGVTTLYKKVKAYPFIGGFEGGGFSVAGLIEMDRRERQHRDLVKRARAGGRGVIVRGVIE